MYSNQSFDEKVTGGKRTEDYDLCNTETGQKYVIKWSPQDRTRYLSKNRYASPRSVSKSVPRRKRGIVRYNINRSLNFDVGSRKIESFKSPNSSSDSSVSVDGDQYLSRSARILRALNINYSPLQSAKLGARKINKSLNFDLSPSSKRLTNFAKSPRNHSLKTYPSPLSKINKTLNFDSSPSESIVHGSHDSSVESIDENQNQTPSQRSRSAKKSLNYLTPGSDRGFGIHHSPILRSGLKENIDNIVLSTMTPNMQSAKRILIKSKFDDFGASTPRNLFNDFGDEDNNEDYNEDGRPQTPENVFRIIPESMSAIKKSHKKERVMGRIGKAVAYQVEVGSADEPLTDIKMHTAPEETRPEIPSITVDQYQSPQCPISSIKKSHKKDKRKRKLFAYQSEDEMSDTGSIFDYTEESNLATDVSRENNNTELKLPESHVTQPKDEAEEENRAADTKSESSVEEILSEDAAPEVETENEPSTSSGSFSTPEAVRDADLSELQEESSEAAANSPSIRSVTHNVESPPRNAAHMNPLRPVTPENRINFLQRIMTDSIKKSHKKIKDINRKSLFKPRIIHDEAEDVRKSDVVESEDAASTEESERAATPENTNSSRLLLSQFSSVKKSHRKDKHRRILSGLVQRNAFPSNEGAPNSEGEPHNCSAASSTSDLPRLTPLRMSSSSKRGELSSDNSNDSSYENLLGTPLKDALPEIGIEALPNTDVLKSSPNKRKNLPNVSSNCVSLSSSNSDSISMEYESAEEEFKIFTPIKKRKSLGIVAPTARRICEKTDLSPEKGKSMDEASTENSASRCSTPTTARGQCLKLIDNSFRTPDRSDVAVADSSSPMNRSRESVDDPSGRSTPQNSSTAALMAGINSIKKSHKKDKRGNISKRSLICAQEEYESEAASSLDKCSNSRNSLYPPSSSSVTETPIEEATSETAVQTKTPPNCLKVKNYLRLLQTASIKRSHKKVRDRKKYGSVAVDTELSDDGSLFDESERSVAMENESLKEGRRGEKEQTVTLKEDEDAGPTRYCGNLSDDGSIFDPEEKLESSYKSGKSGESSSPV